MLIDLCLIARLSFGTWATFPELLICVDRDLVEFNYYNAQQVTELQYYWMRRADFQNALSPLSPHAVKAASCSGRVIETIKRSTSQLIAAAGAVINNSQ